MCSNVVEIFSLLISFQRELLNNDRNAIEQWDMIERSGRDKEEVDRGKMKIHHNQPEKKVRDRERSSIVNTKMANGSFWCFWRIVYMSIKMPPAVWVLVHGNESTHSKKKTTIIYMKLVFGAAANVYIYYITYTNFRRTKKQKSEIYNFGSFTHSVRIQFWVRSLVHVHINVEMIRRMKKVCVFFFKCILLAMYTYYTERNIA